MPTRYVNDYPRVIAAVLIALVLFIGCEGTAPTPTSAPPGLTPGPPTSTPTPGATARPPTAPPVSEATPTVQAIASEMVLVEPGSFQMGATDGEENERPVHTVHITRPFYVARYELTFDQYDRFCADTTGIRRAQDFGWGRGTRPVAVRWYDAVAYCNWLSEKEGLTPCYSGKGRVTRCDFSANGYRLPTEAEWEYAARGGHLSQGYKYAGSDDPDEVAWYADNSGGRTHPVGQKKPNELGLYDMSGNMVEWCWDWYGKSYYTSSPASDPKGPISGTGIHASDWDKVKRSGGFGVIANYLRPAFRSADGASYPGGGIRLARTK